MKHLLVNRLMSVGLLLMLTMSCSKSQPTQNSVGDPELGKALIRDHGCIACHRIPGIAGHEANVGPPLDKIGSRTYIAGILTNTPENMVRWLMDPPAIDPQTAMPDTGLSQAEAEHIAAYLYTLK
jgi:cytochrome c